MADEIDLNGLAKRQDIKVTIKPPEPEDDRKARLARLGLEHGEQIRQRRMLFNVMLSGVSLLTLASAYFAFLGQTEAAQKLGADLLKVVLAGALGFLAGRKSEKKEEPPSD